MNHCAVQQSAMAAYEEMRRPFVSMVSERKEIFCPKPGRLSRFVAAADAIRPLRWHLGLQTEPCESKPGSEVLDLILAKSSSPPYFCGSPPVRSKNPVALDARFADPTAEIKSGGPKSGPAPAAVRIEGFDCSQGIAAFA